MTFFSKFESGRKSRKTENSEDSKDNVVPSAASSTASVPHQAQTSTTGPASQSSPGQAAFASSTPDTPPSSLHLDPATQQNTTEVALPRPKEELDLWARAYGILQAQSPSEYGRLSDIEVLLSGLPSEVSEAYEKILQRSNNELHTQTLLEIVLAAARPLTLDEANVALTMALKKGRFDSYAALESSMWPRGKFENMVKDLCGHFISVHESTLSFIHQTAREFLIHPEKKGRWQGRLDMSKAHGRMAMICMEYLSYVDEPIPVSEDRMPLAQYSAQYWTDHAKAAETEEDVQESILDFFIKTKRIEFGAFFSTLNGPLLHIHEPLALWQLHYITRWYAVLSERRCYYWKKVLISMRKEVNMGTRFRPLPFMDMRT